MRFIEVLLHGTQMLLLLIRQTQREIFRTAWHVFNKKRRAAAHVLHFLKVVRTDHNIIVDAGQCDGYAEQPALLIKAAHHGHDGFVNTKAAARVSEPLVALEAEHRYQVFETADSIGDVSG